MAEPVVKAKWNFLPIEGVKNIIAVASGKGGVGKSTTAVMLAYALQSQGKNVGILDADIYGPSIPRMLGLNEKPPYEAGMMHPLEKDGVKAISIGLIADDQALVWRGPMVGKALNQMLRGTCWGTDDKPLDTLLIDMPPGTGDIHLSMMQQVPLDGAIIVTTPQEVAIADARKAIQMFQKVNVPIIGVIENMSYFIDSADKKHHLFGEGGGKALAQEMDVPFVGEIPLTQEVREKLDQGLPIPDDMLFSYCDILSRL